MVQDPEFAEGVARDQKGSIVWKYCKIDVAQSKLKLRISFHRISVESNASTAAAEIRDRSMRAALGNQRAVGAI